MPKINLNDISMYYEIQGQGESVIFISGMNADHLPWLPIAEKLSTQYQIVLFNNRGAGQTDVSPGPYTIEQMADDVALLCSRLGIKKAHFVGNSMGGYIVQMLCFRHPALVKSLVISNSAMTTNIPFRIFSDAQLELLKANAPLASLIKAACSWLFSYHFLSEPGKLAMLIQLQLQNPFPTTIAGYEAQQSALNSFNSTAWIKEVKVPTLVISSDQDLIFNPLLCDALAEQIKGSKCYRFKICGHLPHVEYPEEYTQVISDFLAQI